MQQKTAILLVVSFVLLVGGSDAHSIHREKRALSNEQEEYLADLYNRFNPVFQNNYRQTANSNQFAVATVNQPDNLEPCSLVMNEDQGTISSSNNNYLAYTPRPSPTRPNGQQHAEVRIILSFDAATRGVSVGAVYLVTHFSPCRFCSNMLQTFVRNHPNINFYIGYVERYQNEDNLNYFIQQVGNEPNVQQGQIALPVCHDELRRKRSATCPVKIQCGGGGDGDGDGCFPGNALVNINDLVSPTKKMEELRIGDKVLTINSEGKVVYSPVIAFLDRTPTTRQDFIEIQTENHRKIQLTLDHLIFTDNSTEPVYASDVKLGNSVFIVDPSANRDNTTTPSKVTSINTISATGLYAPLTEEGTIIVDGVLASCYAKLNAPQGDIHSLFGPLRFLYSVNPQDIEAQEEGVHWYAQSLIQAHNVMKTYLPSSLLPSMIAN